MAWGPKPNREPRPDWVPTVDKDLFYRTMDIFNGAFKRKVRLEAGDCNKTDHKTIWVNFREKKTEKIAAYLYFQEDEQKYVFALSCGHTHLSKKQYDVGDEVNCGRCGGAQAYLGFEHEWEHIYFKSDLVLRKIFVDEYVKILTAQTPVDPQILEGFLHMFVNAFDDIRVNSLQEKIYPGSAERIWQRWTRLTEEKDKSNLIGFIFAVALGVPTDPSGPFEPLRPVIEYATQKVRYKGPGTMYTIVRWALDRSMGAILAHLPPPQPPPPPQPQQGQSPPAQQESDDDDQKEGQDSGPGTQANGANQAGQAPQGPQQSSPSPPNSPGTPTAGSGQQSVEPQPPDHVPSGEKMASQDPQAAAHALGRMALGAQSLDPSEDHPMPSAQDIEAFKKDPYSRTMLAALGNALGKIPDTIDLAQVPAEQVDPDMSQQIDQLRQVQHVNKDQQLTSDAKAKVQLIDVTPEGMGKDRLVLSEEEKASIERMRSAFYRVMGRQKAKRSEAGASLDMQALIQYLASIGDEGDDTAGSADDAVFEEDQNNQGFCYLVESDMSGSMRHAFGQVCHATEMLKLALKFPFVEGDLWGFRGSQDIQGKRADAGEVWIYRYDKLCQSYTGTAKGGNKWEPLVYPVNCGGLTPMNSAIHVGVRHLMSRPVGMAKNLFLITDGSPVQLKTDRTKNGHFQAIPEFLLRQFVKKEINWARQKGIGVYTLIIGHQISDEDALQMFGPRKYWRRVSHGDGPESLARVLPQLVMENFTRHLKR